MIAQEDIDFTAIERQVVERIRALAAICSDRMEATDEMRSAIFRNLVLPNLTLLAQFCFGVSLDDETQRQK